MYQPRRVSTYLLLVVCCLACVLVFQNSRPRFIISVQTEPTLAELSQLVRKQGETIQNLRAHPRVIFRCLDDEPLVRYPKQARDDLTEIWLTTKDECGDTNTTDALVIVHSAADHFDRRRRFRNLLGNFNNTKPFRLKVVFLLGSVIDAGTHLRLQQENRERGDTVVGYFLDTYQNLTLKAVMGFRWVANTCPGVKLLIKMDDDVFFDTRKFFSRYWLKLGSDRQLKTIHCLVWHNARVGRSGKWKVEKGLYANASYPFPYCGGFFVVISPDLIQPLYEFGKQAEFFWIDDVFMYGMVPAAIRGVHFIQLAGNKRLLTQSYQTMRVCREKEKTRCSYWVSLTNGGTEFDAEASALMSASSGSGNSTENNTDLVKIHR